MASSFSKRQKERQREDKQRDKQVRREQKRVEKVDRPAAAAGEDPDLVGIVVGPQPRPAED